MNIYNILASKPHNPHYLNRYIKFITGCQQKNTEYKGYTEKHHICPKAKDMFPEYSCLRKNSWNKANLTPRQHFIAHIMLWKAYPEIRSPIEALNYMSINISKKYARKSSLYSAAKKKYIELLSDTVLCKDNKGNFYQVSKNDPRYISGELVGIRKGLVSVIDENGNTTSVSVNDQKYISGEYKPVNTGYTIAKNKEGKTYRVKSTDPRLLTGELNGIQKGFVSVKDKKGKTCRVSKNDVRYKSGELTGATKNRINVYDISNPNVFFMVNTDDPMLKEGKYVPVNKGRVVYTNGKENKMLRPGQEVPPGFYKGKTMKKKIKTS